MTQNHRTRKPSCPHCEAKLKCLYYIVHKSVSGNFSLDRGHEENLCPDQDGIEYCCPECNVELFHNETLAEAFLLGRKARPILLEKETAKQVETGDEASRTSNM